MRWGSARRKACAKAAAQQPLSKTSNASSYSWRQIHNDRAETGLGSHLPAAKVLLSHDKNCQSSFTTQVVYPYTHRMIRIVNQLRNTGCISTSRRKWPTPSRLPRRERRRPRREASPWEHDTEIVPAHAEMRGRRTR